MGRDNIDMKNKMGQVVDEEGKGFEGVEEIEKMILKERNVKGQQ